MFHDLKKNYGVKIQLDDHVGWPSTAPGYEGVVKEIRKVLQQTYDSRQ
jgi:hypothetical protein